jgi:hypothetical protein
METINGDLLINGDLICGDDGILEATGSVTWHFDLALDESMEKAKELFKDIPKGDFNLAGREVRVEGNCLVWGKIIYDYKTFKGHVTACCDYKQ